MRLKRLDCTILVCLLLLLIISMLPLYVISLNNHPYYDDFGFSAPVRKTWVETGSVSAVVGVAMDNAKNIRNNWQGTYTGTILSNLQPAIFGEQYYFISNWFLITTFLLGFGYALYVFANQLMRISKVNSLSLSVLMLFLIVQFMPDVGEAFYWFNAGIGNIFIYSILIFHFALIVKLHNNTNIIKRIFYLIALVMCVVLLGGGSYGGGLFGLSIYSVLVTCSWVKRWRERYELSFLMALFAFLFLYSMTAPGNGVRAGLIAYDTSPVKAILQAIYYGGATVGNFFSLSLLGICLGFTPIFVESAKHTKFTFKHPWVVAIITFLLYCTQLVPPIYSGIIIGGGRIVNTYFISYVVLFIAYWYYFVGHLTRRFTGFSQGCSSHKNVISVAMAIVFLFGLCNAPVKRNQLIGLQNTASASAVISLLNGEAKSYDAEMSEREILLNNENLPVIELKPLSKIPPIFMQDLIIPDAIYDVRPSLCAYYAKERIDIAGEGELR